VTGRPPAVEILTIGNELLRGDTIDGNAAWLGRRLGAVGIRVVRRATVGDDAAVIRAALGEALARTGTVLCTGGLGPTSDDLTRPAVAAFYGRALHLDAAVLEQVERRFAARGIAMPPSNRVQAEVPAGAHVFANPAGTAPGLALDDAALGATILLPGVPNEVHALVEHGVLDWLRARWPELAPMTGAVLRTTGLGESALFDQVRDLVPDGGPVEVAFLPSWNGVDVRFTAAGHAHEVNALADTFAARLEPWCYGRDERDLAEVLGAALRARGEHVALAESCTGGMVARRLTDHAGASDYLHAGFVVYHNDAKQALLGVPAATLEAHGAVSEATARAMLDGARRAAGAACGIAVTGVAGPGGGTADKPVGTVWIAAGAGGESEVRQFRFVGSRDAIRHYATQAALRMLHRLIVPAAAVPASGTAR
jgi:nicotinamide-nucleotide amidase